MENNRDYTQRRDQLRRILQQLDALLTQADASLDAASDVPTQATVSELEGQRAKLQALVQDYLQENAALLGDMREQVRMIEEANRKAAMADKRAKPARDDARIQALSGELSTKLRLDRVDAAIKELLDFLSDAEFLAANASIGRRRRLKSLQNAIEKALEN